MCLTEKVLCLMGGLLVTELTRELLNRARRPLSLPETSQPTRPRLLLDPGRCSLCQLHGPPHVLPCGHHRDAPLQVHGRGRPESELENWCGERILICRSCQGTAKILPSCLILIQRGEDSQTATPSRYSYAHTHKCLLFSLNFPSIVTVEKMR